MEKSEKEWKEDLEEGEDQMEEESGRGSARKEHYTKQSSDEESNRQTKLCVCVEIIIIIIMIQCIFNDSYTNTFCWYVCVCVCGTG